MSGLYSLATLVTRFVPPLSRHTWIGIDMSLIVLRLLPYDLRTLPILYILRVVILVPILTRHFLRQV